MKLLYVYHFTLILVVGLSGIALKPLPGRGLDAARRLAEEDNDVPCRRAAYNACILYPHYPALLSSGPPRHCRRHIKSWQLTCESSPTEATGRHFQQLRSSIPLPKFP